jgi:hypothetical protein
MHSLPDEAPPSLTVPSRPYRLPYSAAIYSLAFSITAASTGTCADYTARLTLLPASIASAGSTNTTALEQKAAIVAPTPSWLETTIDALLSATPEEAWSKPLDKSLADLDKNL